MVYLPIHRLINVIINFVLDRCSIIRLQLRDRRPFTHISICFIELCFPPQDFMHKNDSHMYRGCSFGVSRLKAGMRQRTWYFKYYCGEEVSGTTKPPFLTARFLYRTILLVEQKNKNKIKNNRINIPTGPPVLTLTSPMGPSSGDESKPAALASEPSPRAILSKIRLK